MKKYNKGGRKLKVYAQETSKVPQEARGPREDSRNREKEEKWWEFIKKHEGTRLGDLSMDLQNLGGLGAVTEQDTINAANFQQNEELLFNSPDISTEYYEALKKSFAKVGPLTAEELKKVDKDAQKKIEEREGGDYNIGGITPKTNINMKKTMNNMGASPRFMQNQNDMVGEFIYAQETSKVPGGEIIPFKGKEEYIKTKEELLEEGTGEATVPRATVYDKGFFDKDGNPTGWTKDYIEFMKRYTGEGKPYGTESIFDQWFEFGKSPDGGLLSRIGKEGFQRRDMSKEEAEKLMKWQKEFIKGDFDLASIPEEYKQYFDPQGIQQYDEEMLERYFNDWMEKKEASERATERQKVKWQMPFTGPKI